MTVSLFFLLFHSFFCLSETNVRSLSDASVKKIETRSSKPRVYVVFQKDCHACRSQVKELKCLEDYADILLVGSFSSESDLRKEYRIFNSKYTGVYGDTSFREKFKVREKLTPQIILSKNRKSQVILGTLPCHEIYQKLKKGL